MYRAYLKLTRRSGSETFDITRTPSQVVAETAYRELLTRCHSGEFDGKLVAAVLSLDNRQLMYHRNDRRPGDADYVAPDAPLRLSFEEG